MTFPNGITISDDTFSSIWSGDARNVLTDQLNKALLQLQCQIENFEKWKSAKKEAERYSKLKARTEEIDEELTDLDPLLDANKVSSLNGEKRGISSSMGLAKKSAQASLDEIKPYYAQFKKVNYQFADNYRAFIEDLDQISISSYDGGEYGLGIDEQPTDVVLTPSIEKEMDAYVWSVRGNEETDPEIAASLARERNASDGMVVANYSTIPFHDELNTDFSLGGYESLVTKYENIYPDVGKYSNRSGEVHSELVPEWFKNKGSSIDGKHYVDLGVASPVSSDDKASVSSGDALILKKKNEESKTVLVLNNDKVNKSMLVAEVGKMDKVVSLQKFNYQDVTDAYVVKNIGKFYSK